VGACVRVCYGGEHRQGIGISTGGIGAGTNTGGGDGGAGGGAG
jgi:hypothetical protein